MSEQPPPPYFPQHPSGSIAPSFPPAFNTQPSAFPGSPYQTFPQTYGGDQFYYQGPPGPIGPPGSYPTLPGYQGYPSVPSSSSYPWDGQKMYGETPKQNTMFVVDQNRGGGHGRGAEKSCLAACSAALCCCCLWDMLTNCLS